ncbi:MAG: hypothetical protein V1887_02370 [Candidatus Aenigmatarchaeota archaeon]
MLKGGLIERTENLLEQNGWATVRYHGCFDIAARKEGTLLVKLLTNVDALPEGHADSLKTIANSLDATALLVGERTSREKLGKGVVYERFDIPTVSFDTFEQLIEQEIMPRMYRDKGGLYVEIDSSALKTARNSKGLTQMELAEAVGISKKAIWEHEKRELRMMLSIAERLEGVLKKSIVKDIELGRNGFEQAQTVPKDKLEKAVGTDLRRLGFSLDFVKNAPFDVLARKKTLVISDVEPNKRRIKLRAEALSKFISLMRKPAVMITEGKQETEFGGIPVLPEKELHDFESSREVIRLARKARPD